MQATIQLEYRCEKTAEAVAKAVSPDNFKTPPGLQVETVLEKGKVITRINCVGALATFTATVDDLLFCASTAERAIDIVKKM